MKFAFAASLVAFANAGKVHEFFAETNLICHLCTEVMNHAQSNNISAIDDIYKMFPKLEERINAFSGANELIDFAQAEASCQKMDLCEGPKSIEELIMEERPLDLEAIANEVNSNPKATWKANPTSRFSGMTRKQIMKMMGTVVDPDWVVRAPEIWRPEQNQAAPSNFDSSLQWPDCAPPVQNNDANMNPNLITWARDQSDCGSCWAHGTTEAFNDRWCIASVIQNGTPDLMRFSVADTSGCCGGNNCLSFDCNGGQVATPWRWFKNVGVVNGGAYNDTSSTNWCYDYTMPMCAHHVAVTAPITEDCSMVPTVAPTCPADTAACPNNGLSTYSSFKKKSQSNYGFGGDVAAVQANIQLNGPVSGAFTVYEDFLTYTSGIYVHTSGASLGGHAIKIYGWGLDATTGQVYWICMNSWNQTWGMNGAFWIEMGQCGINNEINGGDVTWA